LALDVWLRQSTEINTATIVVPRGPEAPSITGRGFIGAAAVSLLGSEGETLLKRQMMSRYVNMFGPSGFNAMHFWRGVKKFPLAHEAIVC